MLAEEDDGEDGDLHRLRLGVGDGDDEGALAHRRKHQGGRRDLAERARARPGERRGVRRRHVADDKRHEQECEEAEGQAEEKADVGRADGAEARGQTLLRRVAEGLGDRRDDREDRPEPGRCVHGVMSERAEECAGIGRTVPSATSAVQDARRFCGG